MSLFLTHRHTHTTSFILTRPLTYQYPLTPLPPFRSSSFCHTHFSLSPRTLLHLHTPWLTSAHLPTCLLTHSHNLSLSPSYPLLTCTHFLIHLPSLTQVFHEVHIWYLQYKCTHTHTTRRLWSSWTQKLTTFGSAGLKSDLKGFELRDLAHWLSC